MAKAMRKPTAKAPPGPGGMRLTHPDRVVFPAQGLTKRDLAEYYADIAPHILPHIAGRPLSLVRCPSGAGDKCFYQKHPVTGMSAAIRRVRVKEKSGTENYVYVDDERGLLELIQFGTLEIHPWGSRFDDLDHPDLLIFDLDPDPSVPWKRVVEAAHETKALLEEIGLRSFAKSTGGKGLHVVVPIKPTVEWAPAKQFCRQIAELLETRAPGDYTTNMSKAVRKNRIFVDYLRNDFGSTAIAAFSTRAREGAPVSVPLAWREVTPALKPASFTLTTVRERLKRQRVDPWKEFWKLRQELKL
jgi:bifunctional non-homologous end joining protein LigD